MPQVLRIALVTAAIAAAAPAFAQAQKPAAQKPGAASAQPTPLGQFGDWQAFTLGTDKRKSCFAISNPKDRKPSGLTRDPATFFVTHRPGEGVRNEISLIVGFPMKEGVDAAITIGKSTYALYTKESNAWVKNAAEEGTVINVMKKGKDLVFEGTSRRGNKTTDRYSLTGLSGALDAISKACQ
jgi:invasion protein IalB